MPCGNFRKGFLKQAGAAMPVYFSLFGVTGAARYLGQARKKADADAKQSVSRPPTPTERQCLLVLAELTHDLDQKTMAEFALRRGAYRVIQTEVLKGHLREGRYRVYPEILLSANCFIKEFAEALPVFLHEHAHIFGRDGSCGFTDALTDLLGALVRKPRESGRVRRTVEQGPSGRVEGEERRSTPSIS